jgi:hypothetical protein
VIDRRQAREAERYGSLPNRLVQVECLRTDAAVRRYGELDERNTAAALHLTC